MSAVTKLTNTVATQTTPFGEIIEEPFQEKTPSEKEMPKLSKYSLLDLSNGKNPYSICFSCYQVALKTLIAKKGEEEVFS